MADKIISAIYETFDYDKFKRFPENREVTRDRINKLRASISEKYNMCPIIVNERFEIGDGQGRYEALKELGLPIRYVIDEGLNIDDCRRMNRYNKPWTVDEFVYSHAASGKEAYKRLLSLRTELKMPYARILSFCKRSAARSIINTELMSGEMTFTESDEKKVRDIATACAQICEALCYRDRRTEAFYTAVKVIWNTEGYDHEKMLRNCRKERTSYEQMANLEAELKEFSRIYNRGSKKKLYFEDYMRNRGHNVRTYENNFPRKKSVDVSTLNVRGMA